MDDKFFLVWNPNGMGPPRYRHGTKESAEKEALRLAGENPGQTFHVLENIGTAKTQAAVFTPVEASAAPSEQPILVLKHGEYLPGNRVRYTGRGPGRFAGGAVGRIGLFQEMGDSGFCLVEWAGIHSDIHIRNIEHETLPQFEVGDEVRTRSGDRGVIESMGATTASIMGSDGHGFTTHYSLLSLVCPVQRRGAK
ncbi:hypothetical protein V5F34_08705 [Xanthobacter autotrophicus]|uniref:hypothetical protein n=1 Tax=Xanthobacter autotrophicus TaxID=280 RepID=UPI00372A7AAF